MLPVNIRPKNEQAATLSSATDTPPSQPNGQSAALNVLYPYPPVR